MDNLPPPEPHRVIVEEAPRQVDDPPPRSVSWWLLLLILAAFLALPASLTFGWVLNERAKDETAKQRRAALCAVTNENRAIIKSLLVLSRASPRADELTEEERRIRNDFFQSAFDLLEPVDCERLEADGNHRQEAP